MSSQTQETENGRKPNLVLFLADDHGFFETHFDRQSYLHETGESDKADRLLRIPTLDRLGKEGLVFDRAYTCSAMCAPSRAAIYTGLGPHRNGLHPNHASVHEGTRTLPHYLQALGYRVVLAGKRHILPKEAFPFEYVEGDPVIVKSILHDSSEPVCLIYASKDPHWPHRKEGPNAPSDVQLTPGMIDTPATRELVASYWNDVMVLDHEIGQVMAAIETSPQCEHTLFIYTSDHGACLPFAKWTLYEAGVRVPFVAHWPGKITPGHCDALISFVDILPTFVALAGGNPTKDIDGKSFATLMFDGEISHRDLIFTASTSEGIVHGNRYPIRSVRNKDYNYIVNMEPNGTFRNVFTEMSEAERKEYYDLWTSWQTQAAVDSFIASRVNAYQKRPEEELYDLNNDPWEQCNLASDPAYAPLMQSFRASLREWMTQQGDCELETLDALDLAHAHQTDRRQ